MKPKSNLLHGPLAILVFLFLVALACSRDRIVGDFGPSPTRRQLQVVGTFAGDTMFKQPTPGVSETFREPRKPVTGTAIVESISGHIMLPRAAHHPRAARQRHH